MNDTRPHTTDAFEWREPPPRRRTWQQKLAPLRDEPGRWAYIGRHDDSVVSRIRMGDYNGICRGEFEAEMRDRSGTTVDVYARYIGSAS